MTNTELIRQEIERLKAELPKQDLYTTVGADSICAAKRYDELLSFIDSLPKETPETLNGKFVFPKFLYARTTNNKTIDVSYAPQSLDAIEYIRSDDLLLEQLGVDLENYISNKLRELGADLINHKPYSFNRGLNVGKANAYRDILDKLNTRKED